MDDPTGDIASLADEARFHFLTDAIPHKIWTSGPDGRVTYYNRQWHEYTGVEDFGRLKETIWEYIFPEDRPTAEKEWPEAILKGEPAQNELRLKRRDGAYRWHLSRFMPYKDAEGNIILWVGTSTDIHEQKTAELDMVALNHELVAANEELSAVNEEAAAMNEELAATNEELTFAQADLEESERLFRSIALNIPGSVVIVIDRDHRYRTVEGDLMSRLGYDRKNYEGKHPAEISPERYAVSKPLYDRVIAGEQFSVERKAETGEIFLVHFVSLRNDRNEVHSGLIIALDITDIKTAEDRSAKLAAIVESSDDAIISKTFESVITSWNEAAERMFGYRADEIIGDTIYRIIPPERHAEEPAILERLKNGERVERFETVRITKDGRLIDVSLTISPLRDNAGNLIGVSKIARDITEQKRAEQRKIDFIGMVSHELKTPLTSLTGIIQVVAAKLKGHENPFLASAMDRANIQVKKMTTMINGFLDISRLEAGKMLIDPRAFDLSLLVAEIVEETCLIVNTHQIVLSCEQDLTVFADRDKIWSVISNLLSNGIKYSPPGKKIRISCGLKDGMPTVSVRDEGIGVPKRDAEKIFERYYRVENAYSRHISGFGIGLYLSAEIIRQHGGKIWVESEPGNGSAFFFSLPGAKP